MQYPVTHKPCCSIFYNRASVYTALVFTDKGYQYLLSRCFTFLFALTVSLCSYMVIAQEYPTSGNRVLDLSQQQQMFILKADDQPCHYAQSNIITQEDERSISNDGNNTFILNALRRVISHDHRATLGVKPEYHLLVAFLPPPLLQLAVKAISVPDAISHWTSHASYPSSRLAGWKEGNILYTHNHSRLLIFHA